MAYTIYNTDGSILLTLADGKIDQKSTSITLVGRNVNSYGEYLNNNFVSMLANFAGPDEPRSPLVGQLWYDTTTGRVKVYDLNSLFRPITNTIAADNQPVELAVGDLWFDTINNQLYFSVDGQNVTLIGPSESSLFGQTGFLVEEILDNTLVPRYVTSIYNTGQLVGILSTSSFTFQTAKDGMTSVGIGLNLNTSIPGIRVLGTATSADAVAGIDVAKFLRNDINQTTTGSLTVKNDLGFIVSNDNNNQMTLYADNITEIGTIAYNSVDKPFRMQITNGVSGLQSFLHVTGDTEHVGVWNSTPSYPLDIVGDTKIDGNLFVESTATKILANDLEIKNNDIKLAVGQVTNSDDFVDNGGLVLYGTIDHKFIWRKNQTGWNATDSLNLNYETQIYNAVTGTSIVGAGAVFTVTNVDGSYSVSIANSGTNYSTATGFSWSTTTPFVSWSTSTPFKEWSTTTPYVNFWTTGTGTYFNITGTTNGTGSGATFDVSIEYYLGYDLIIVNSGTNYLIGDTITITGNLIGGTSPANDLTVFITATNIAGNITDGTLTGVALWFTTTPFISWSTTTPYINEWTTSTPFVNAWTTSTPLNMVNLGSLITITGDKLGGVTPANDLIVRVLTTGTTGEILSIQPIGNGKLLGFQISSSTVLTKTSLGAGVTKAPGVDTLGTLAHLTVTNVYISGNTISSNGINQDLILNANGTGQLDANNNRIKNVAAPSSSSDASTKQYVDNAIGLSGTKNFAISLDVSNFVTNFGTIDLGVKNYLDLMFPINNPGESQYDIPDGVRAKVLCAQTTVATSSTTIYPSFSTVSVDKDNVASSAVVVSGITNSISAAIPSLSSIPTTVYTVQTWKVQLGVWTKQ